MARRAQHLRCSYVREANERTTSWIMRAQSEMQSCWLDKRSRCGAREAMTVGCKPTNICLTTVSLPDLPNVVSALLPRSGSPTFSGLRCLARCREVAALHARGRPTSFNEILLSVKMGRNVRQPHPFAFACLTRTSKRSRAATLRGSRA